MRELTYSQDVIFSDQSLLNGLLVCSEKVWLPNRGIVDDMLQAAEDCEIIGEDIPFDLQKLRRSIQSDSRRDEIFEWEDRNRLLFDEGVIERLPPSLPNEEGNVLDDLTFADMWGTWKPGITTELALHGHLGVRELVPGYALFDSKNSDATAASAKKAIVAAKFLALNIPKIGNLENDKLLDLREKTQEDDIKDFWEMIDFYSTMTDGNATIASIQKDLDQWTKNKLTLRMKGLSTATMTTLCFINPVFLTAAVLVGLTFLSDANARWAERKLSKNKSFKFICALGSAVK